MAYLPFRKLSTAMKLAGGLVYRRHVALLFPPAVLNSRAGLVALPDGYELRQPPLRGDETAIAAMLSSEPGYGSWTAERVRNELYAKLATPCSASMILYEGTPVGAAFALDASTRRKKVAHGMYLYLVPAHRGRGLLGLFLMRITLRTCIEAGFARVLAYTDPERYSALLLYLSNGALPVRDSLISIWYWRRILRRLAPALRRAEQQRMRRENQPPSLMDAPPPFRSV